MVNQEHISSEYSDLTRPHFSVKIYQSYLRYLSTHFPNIDIKSAVEDIGLPFAYLEDSSNWVSLTFEQKFGEICTRLTGDAELYWKVGRSSLTRELLHPGIYLLGRTLASSQLIYNLAPRFTSGMSNVFSVKLLKSSRGSIKFIVEGLYHDLNENDRDRLRSVMPNIIRNLKGYYEAIPTVKNEGFANVSIDESRVSDEFPIYFIDVSYRYALSHYISLKQKWLGFSTMVCLLFFIPNNLSTDQSIIYSFIFLLISIITLQYFNHRKSENIVNETNLTIENLRRSKLRESEARIKAERRSAELSTLRDVADAMTIDTTRDGFFQTTTDSIVKNIHFDRAIIYIANDERTELLQVASSGTDDRMKLTLKNVSFAINIESEDPSKIANVFRTKNAWLIRNVKQHLPSLNIESRHLLELSGSHSFLCVAIASSKASYGVILADYINPHKSIDNQDQDILTTIGKQLALAIERKNSQESEVKTIKNSLILKDQILANTTHDLKNPLHRIVQKADLLINSQLRGNLENNLEKLRVVRTEALLLARAVDNMLHLAKTNHGSAKIAVERTKTTELYLGIIQNHGLSFAKKGLKLNLRFDPRMGEASFDLLSIKRVIDNLLDNAFKFTSEGEVQIAFHQRNLDLLIEVNDTGIGIAESDLGRIFERFYQVDSSKSRRFSGTGLGLANAREAIEAHGGRLTVSSELGKGTRFLIELSKCFELTRNSQEFKEINNSAEFGEIFGFEPVNDPITELIHSRSNGLVLIAEDDQFNREAVEEILRRHNYDYISSADGLECLDKLRNSHKPDVVLIDINMPRMTGDKVAEEIRKTWDKMELPIIFMTAQNSGEQIEAAFRLGTNDYVTKPFLEQELIMRLKSTLQISRLHQAALRFVPQRAVEWLGYQSIEQIKLGDATEINITVLFMDIIDFTRITERMPPKDIAAMLNSFFGATIPIIHQRDGIIDKLTGDGFMVVFRSQRDAVNAVIEIQDALEDYNKRHRSILHDNTSRPARIPLKCRFALNTGSVIFAAIGSKDYIEITSLSSTVNVASRLEGLAKEYGARIISSAALLPYLEGLNIRYLGKLPVRGQAQPVPIIEVIYNDDSKVYHQKVQTKDEFERGIGLIEAGESAKALEAFQTLQRLKENDIAVQKNIDILLRMAS